MAVDFEARLDAWKGLLVIFSVSIALSSIGLAVKLLVRLQNPNHGVRRLMLLAMCGGTLLEAIFALAVQARLAYEPLNTSLITCDTQVTSTTYDVYFLPFAYATGLVSIAVELYQAHKGAPLPKPLIVQLIYVAVPGLVSLVLVLPLTLAGVDWDRHCTTNFTLDRVRSCVVVCCLLPAIGVLFIVSVLKSIIKNSAPTTFNAPQGVVISPNSSQPGYPLTQSHPPPQNQPFVAQRPYPPPTNQAPPQGYDHDKKSSEPLSHPAPPTGPSYQQPPLHHATAYPAAGPPYQHTTTLQQAQHQPAPRDLHQEASTLFKAGLIFFIFTMPKVIFDLAYKFNMDIERMDHEPEAFFSDTTYWLSVLRWLLLCILWIVCLK